MLVPAAETAITDEVGLDDVAVEDVDMPPSADVVATGAGSCAAGVGLPQVWPELSAQVSQTRLPLAPN